MIIAVIATFIALISSAMCGTIDVSVSKADLKEGDSVSIIATVKLDTNDIFLYINSELNGNPIATGLIQSYNIQPYGYLIFSNRMATSKSNFDYILTINNLRTNDSVTLKINLSYMKSGTTLSQAYSSIFIDVKADPVVLSFPEVLFIKEGDTLSFESTIFGKPKPVSIVTLREKTFNATSSNEIRNDTYKFVYDLGQLTRNDCGIALPLYVSGNGKVFNQSATVYVQFTPPMIELSSLVQLLDFLVIAKWKPIVSGKCNVSYNVEFLNSTNQTVYLYDGISTTEISEFNSANATSIKIYAVFNGTIGVPIIQNMPLPQTTTTTTTISTTIKSSTTLGSSALAQTGSLEAGSIIGIAVGAVVFIIIIGVIILFIVKRKSTSSSKHPNNKIGGANNPTKADGLPLKDKRRSSEETDFPPPASKKSQDPDQMIYAQLGAGGGRTGPKPNPINSNYAEIKVDDMGYPARGPTSDRLPSNPPPYDGTRRYSRPPSEEFDGGVIV